MGKNHQLVSLEAYEKYAGAETIGRILDKSAKLRDLRVCHVNSTYYGGGVAEILSPLTLLLNNIGIRTGWRVIQGSPDFFSITKKMHNALQGEEINLTKMKMQIYEDIVYENAVRNHLEHDIIIIHDPQPLPIIEHFRKRGPWIWQCHLDLTSPHGKLWAYLRRYIEKYDAVILSLAEYAQDLDTPQIFFTPAIDPFSIKNRELSEVEMQDRLDHYGIPTDLPLVVQVSRFDRWKDPEGVIRAFRQARKEVECTLVLLGNVATDDPEGHQMFESLLGCKEERIIILSHQDTALVNTLQRKAAVVVQKSLREGFGLTLTEAMWKGAAVIGGNVGGLRHQIKDGVNGFLVSSDEEAAQRIVTLVKDKRLRSSIGRRARESVRSRYLLTRMLEQYLDLFASFETNFRLVRK